MHTLETDKKELETYYDNQFTMMALPGWTDLMATATSMYDALNNIKAVRDIEDLRRIQGQMIVLDWLLNWKTSCEEVYEMNFGVSNEKNV